MYGNDKRKVQDTADKWSYVVQEKQIIENKMNLNLIRVLREGWHSKNGVKTKLRSYGLQDDDDFTQPLAEMLPAKAIWTVVNWLSINAKDGHELCLRIPVGNSKGVYEAWLVTKARTNYVKSIRKVPELIGKIWHYWDAHVNYQTLTLEKIKNSTYHADLTEYFIETDGKQNGTNVYHNACMTEKPDLHKQQGLPSMNEPMKRGYIQSLTGQRKNCLKGWSDHPSMLRYSKRLLYYLVLGNASTQNGAMCCLATECALRSLSHVTRLLCTL